MPIQRVCHLMIGQQAATPPSDTFIFTVQTTGEDETFTLPLESDGTYDFSVDWGDSSSDNITEWDDVTKTHTYSSAGTYEISITGTLYGFRFGYTGDRTKIYEIKAWGPIRLGNNEMYFAGCTNLTITATDILDLTGTTTLKQAFWANTSLTTIPSMNSWNTSNIVSLESTFDYAILFNMDIGSLDVSSVITMYGTFYAAESFDQDLSGWDISNTENMVGILLEATLSTANYDALLIGWEAQAVQDNVSFHGGGSKYSAGAAATARAALISDHSWDITDAGEA